MSACIKFIFVTYSTYLISFSNNFSCLFLLSYNFLYPQQEKKGKHKYFNFFWGGGSMPSPFCLLITANKASLKFVLNALSLYFYLLVSKGKQILHFIDSFKKLCIIKYANMSQTKTVAFIPYTVCPDAH